VQEFPSSELDLSATGHSIGDVQSVTDAAGHVTQYTLYDPAGRVRQMVDPKGITTDITYTPRGWVSTVTVTPPGGSGRVTTYSYDFVGQVTGVALPDDTSVSYTYDAAHRLTGASDARGNSVTYTLDDSGNRIGEELRDPGGSLQRTVSRSFDALNRLQQAVGAPN
jgi:YD repeat-containing protein